MSDVTTRRDERSYLIIPIYLNKLCVFFTEFQVPLSHHERGVLELPHRNLDRQPYPLGRQLGRS